MMQGVEGVLFILDYDKLSWLWNMKPFQISTIISIASVYQGYSFMKSINQLLSLASMKAKIEAALEFIKKQPYRRVFQ